MCNKFKLSGGHQQWLDLMSATNGGGWVGGPGWDGIPFSPGSMIAAFKLRGDKLDSSIERWGIPKFGTSDQFIYNARAESLLEKDFWNYFVKVEPRVIPCGEFIEKDQAFSAKTPFLMPAVARPEGLAIITSRANQLVMPYHDRMPIMMTPAEAQEWIRNPESIQKYATPWDPKFMLMAQVA